MIRCFRIRLKYYTFFKSIFIKINFIHNKKLSGKSVYMNYKIRNKI